MDQHNTGIINIFNMTHIPTNGYTTVNCKLKISNILDNQGKVTNL